MADLIYPKKRPIQADPDSTFKVDGAFAVSMKINGAAIQSLRRSCATCASLQIFIPYFPQFRLWRMTL